MFNSFNSQRDRPGPAANAFRRLALIWLAPAILVLAISAGAAEVPSVTGITEPFLDVPLSAPVSGIVMSRKCSEGDFVKEGDVILALDQKLEELEAERRRLVRDQKWSDFDGTKKLFGKTKGVSKEEVEKKEAEFRIAAVEHDMAIEQLNRRRLVAPFSGTITEMPIDVGEACQPPQMLARLVDTSRCYFIANLEPGPAARLKAGQTVKIELSSGAGHVPIRGRIVSRSPVVDPASGLQRIKVLFDNPDGKIAPGVAAKMLLE